MLIHVGLLFIGILSSPAAHADAPAITPSAGVVADDADQKALERFVGLVERGSKEEAGEMIAYPLRRANPLPPIRTKEEFAANFADFFDAATIAQLTALVKNKNEQISNGRGTSLGGALWASGGKITAINVATAKQKKAADAALKLEKRNTHSSVDKYEAVEFACDAPSHRVRIQRLVGGNYRYVSWRPGESLSAVPEQVIEKGTPEAQGTGGGMIYRFRDGKTAYEVTKTVTCGEDCNSYLEITRGKKSILKEVCKELP